MAFTIVSVEKTVKSLLLRSYQPDVSFNEKDQPISYQFYGADGTLTEYDTFIYNGTGQKIEQPRYESAGDEICYFIVNGIKYCT